MKKAKQLSQIIKVLNRLTLNNSPENKITK